MNPLPCTLFTSPSNVVLFLLIHIFMSPDAFFAVSLLFVINFSMHVVLSFLHSLIRFFSSFYPHFLRILSSSFFLLRFPSLSLCPSMLAEAPLQLLSLVIFATAIAALFCSFRFGLRHFFNGFTVRSDIIHVTGVHISIHQIYDNTSVQCLALVLTLIRSHSCHISKNLISLNKFTTSPSLLSRCTRQANKFV